MRRSSNAIPKLHIRRGDTVKVLTGNKEFKGQSGRVLRVIPAKMKAIVEGMNMVTRHVKPNQKNPNGARVQQEAPIHVSNLQLVEPKTGVATRTGRVKTEKGWVRVSKKTGERI